MRSSSARSSRGAWGLPKWRYVNSGSEATMDAIRIARAATGRDTIVKIFGSYHGHHDYVMVSIGVEYDRDRGAVRPAVAAVREGIPQPVVDLTVPVPFNDAGGDGAPDRAPHRGGAPARLRDHGGRDDEPRRGAARARLPRSGSRDHAPARDPPHLRRGEDRPLHRGRRSDRAVRRHAGPRHAGEGARRRAAVGRHRRQRGGVRARRGGQGRAGRHLQRQPAHDGGGAGEPARGDDAGRPTPTSTRSTSTCSPAARR